MSKYITQKNDISTYLEFSNLQIASEAFIGKSQSKDPGTIVSGNRFGKDDLISGNILQSLKISCLTKNAFQEYARAEGKLGGQNKIPRLANDRKIAEILEKFKELA